MATHLRPETQRRVEMLFSPEDRQEASRMLREGFSVHFIGQDDFLERLRFAALRVSRGDLERLRKAINRGNIDFRDLLTAAGFHWSTTGHKRWLPKGEEEMSWWEKLKEKRQRVRERGWGFK